MDTAHLQQSILSLIDRHGDLGVFTAMLLESSIVPIPSEVIVVGAGALGIPIISIVVFGSLGATCGGCIGYCLGRFAAEPLLMRFGKYLFITRERIQKAEAFAAKYGAPGVFLGRVIPIVPFKVFSIASGLTRIPFVPFLIFSFLGVIPRILILAFFGQTLVRYTVPALFVTAAVLLVVIIYKVASRKKIRC